MDRAAETNEAAADRIRDFHFKGEKTAPGRTGAYRSFRDPAGRFTLTYPSSWKCRGEGPVLAVGPNGSFARVDFIRGASDLRKDLEAAFRETGATLSVDDERAEMEGREFEWRGVCHDVEDGAVVLSLCRIQAPRTVRRVRRYERRALQGIREAFRLGVPDEPDEECRKMEAAPAEEKSLMGETAKTRTGLSLGGHVLFLAAWCVILALYSQAWPKRFSLFLHPAEDPVLLLSLLVSLGVSYATVLLVTAPAIRRGVRLPLIIIAALVLYSSLSLMLGAPPGGIMFLAPFVAYAAILAAALRFWFCRRQKPLRDVIDEMRRADGR